MNNDELNTVLETFHEGMNLNLYLLDKSGNVIHEFIRPLAPHLSEKMIERILTQASELDILMPNDKNTIGKFIYDNLIIVGWNTNMTIAGGGNYDRLAPLLGYNEFSDQMKSLYYMFYQKWPQTGRYNGQLATGENVEAPAVFIGNYEGYMAEQEMLESVTRGDLKLYNQRFRSFVKNGIFGKLNSDKLRSEKDLAISATTLYTRAAIAGGLPASEAYGLSDAIINRIEKDHVISNYYEYTRAIGEIFVNRVARFKRTNMTSIVYKANEYIYKNFRTISTVNEIADSLNISISYLQHLFKKETSHTLAQAINQEKIRQAKHDLIFTDMSIGEICDELGFSSISVFSATFKKITNQSPLKYRKEFK